MDNSPFQPPFGPSMDSLCRPGFTTTNPSYRFPIFETFATALCGNTGNPQYNYRRKFRSQTSDNNMDKWKAEVGRVREEKRRGEERREEKRRRKKIKKRESLRRKKIQVREKVGKSRNTVFFKWLVAPEGRKVLAKAAGAKPAGQMRDKQLHAVVARSTLEVKTYQTPQLRMTCRSWDVEKVHAVVARSTFRSQYVQNTPGSVKMYKTHQVRTTFGSWDVEKVHDVVVPSTFRSQHVQNTQVWTTFGSWDVEKVHAVVAGSTFRSQNVKSTACSDHFLRDCAPCQKWAKREGFVAFPKTMAGVGHLKRICKDKFCVPDAVQETCSSEMFGGQGADFLRRVAFWSIRSLGLLRWFCATGATLCMTWHHFFLAGAVL